MDSPILKYFKVCSFKKLATLPVFTANFTCDEDEFEAVKNNILSRMESANFELSYPEFFSIEKLAFLKGKGSEMPAVQHYSMEALADIFIHRHGKCQKCQDKNGFKNHMGFLKHILSDEHMAKHLDNEEFKAICQLLTLFVPHLESFTIRANLKEIPFTKRWIEPVITPNVKSPKPKGKPIQSLFCKILDDQSAKKVSKSCPEILDFYEKDPPPSPMAKGKRPGSRRNTAQSEVNEQVKNPVMSKKAKDFFAPFDNRPKTLRSEGSAISVLLKDNIASTNDTKVDQPLVPQSSLGKLPSNKDVSSTVPADDGNNQVTQPVIPQSPCGNMSSNKDVASTLPLDVDSKVGQPVIPQSTLGNLADLRIPEDMWTFMNDVEMTFLKRVNATHAVDLLLLAQKYNFTELKGACIKKIAYYMRETDKKIRAEELPADIAKEILIKMNL